MNKSKTSDKTVYTETGRVESCCNQCDQVVVDQDSVLKCASCKLFVHFLCSKLPVYQLFAFINTRRVFTCEKCTVVPAGWFKPSNSNPPLPHPNNNACTKDDVSNLLNSFEKTIVKSFKTLSLENFELKENNYKSKLETLNKEKAQVNQMKAHVPSRKITLGAHCGAYPFNASGLMELPQHL